MISKTFPRVQELIKAEIHKCQSVNKVALATGLSNNTIGKYMEGISEPQQETLEKLAQYFGVTVAWLRGDSSVATPSHNLTHDTVLLSSLSDEQRQAWETMRRLSPGRLKATIAFWELLNSDE